jgi:Protein of unknown function (DUF998)
MEQGTREGAASRRKEKPMAHISQPNSLASQSDTSSVDMGKGLQSRLTFGLMLCGGVGAILFTAIYLLEGISRPGYDAWQQPISALSLGPGGWVEQANFIAYGVILVLSAVGWYRFLTPGRGAIWFPLFQGISGLCLIGAGVFSMDPFPGYPSGTTLTPSTVHGTLHSILAWVLILTLAMGCFAFAQSALHAHWRGWFVYSLITGMLILIFWGGFLDGASGTVAGLVPLAGLAERLSAGSHDFWICLLVVTLFFRRRRREVTMK